MANQLIQDDNGLPTSSSPAAQLSQFLQDNWAISDPAVSDITWQSYWMPTAAITIAFREVTLPQPMVVGWHKWFYDSNVSIIMSAWFEGNGDYPAIMQKVRNRIEELLHMDVTAMAPYGFTLMRIVRFSDIVDYEKEVTYKDSVADFLIEVALKGSKTVVPV